MSGRIALAFFLAKKNRWHFTTCLYRFNFKTLSCEMSVFCNPFSHFNVEPEAINAYRDNGE